MTVAHLDQLVGYDPMPTWPPPRAEMTRVELMAFHHRAVALARVYGEFFADVKRPSGCPFDAKAAPGTLAALMQAGAR